MASSIRRRDLVTLAAGAATLPLTGLVAARAQQRSVPVIGYLDAGSESARAPFPLHSTGVSASAAILKAGTSKSCIAGQGLGTNNCRRWPRTWFVGRWR